MKVFAPGLALRLYSCRVRGGSETYVGGIPVSGEWVEVPDYFVQVTSGRKENTCVHAKVVADRGLPITVAASTFSDGAKMYNNIEGTPTGSSDWGLYGGVEVTSCHYTVEIVERYRFPKNYKGKKPIVPRKYHEPVYTTKACNICCWDYQYTKGSGISACIHAITGVRVNSSTHRLQYRVGSFNLDARGFTWRTCHQVLRPLLDPIKDAIASRWDPNETHPWGTHRDMAYMAAQGISALAYEIAEAVYGLNTGTWIYPESVTGVLPDQPKNLRDAFLLDEDYIIGEGLDPVLLGRDTDFSNYWRGWLTQHALLEACESFPKLNDNSIQNIMEIVGFIKALVVDHRIEIPKSLSSGWLAYRYQYSTTKMDVEEAIKYVHRRMDLGDLDKGISCHGMASCEYKGVTVTCRCSIDIKPRNVGYLAKIWRALDEYGLTPDFYVIWDSIPYSFMVDWFLPIGDILSTFDADVKYFSGEYYDLSEPIYSLSYTRELPGVGEITTPVNVKCYSRWVGSVPTSLNSLYWFDAPSTSSKTVWYRVLDAASMFIGR